MDFLIHGNKQLRLLEGPRYSQEWKDPTPYQIRETDAGIAETQEWTSYLDL